MIPIINRQHGKELLSDYQGQRDPKSNLIPNSWTTKPVETHTSTLRTSLRSFYWERRELSQKFLQMTRHIVVVAIPLWGHTRPLCVFISKLQKASKCLVTFFVPELLLFKVKAEIARQYEKGEEDLLASIR